MRNDIEGDGGKAQLMESRGLVTRRNSRFEESFESIQAETWPRLEP